MNAPIMTVAPAWECARLIVNLSHNPLFEAAALDDLHDLLRRYPAHLVAKAIERACDQLVEEGRTPEWPDNGEADAYVRMLSGSWELADITEQTLTTAA